MLYQVNIVPNLTNKKWSGKELPVKAGEKLDVIVKAVDNKLICRNEDGKSQYLLPLTELINTYYYFIPTLLNTKLDHPSFHLMSVCLYFTVGYVSTSYIVTE